MNRKRFSILFIAALAMLISVSIATAQGPSTGGARAPKFVIARPFTYQGQLKNSGAPVNDTCNFQFGLWDAASSGVQVSGTTTQTVLSVVVSNGLFSTLIDFGPNRFNGDPRYLAIAAACPSGSSYTSMNTRQALTPTPYALYAFSGPFWSPTGNSGTDASTNFVGTTDNVTFTVRVSNTVGWRLAPSGANTPNVIGGYAGNRVSAGVKGATIGGGGNGVLNINVVDANFGTVAGGEGNTAGDHATISGGYENYASGPNATIGGGEANLAVALDATIGGGAVNQATSTHTTVSGGRNNSATNYYATVGGGESNQATASHATVGGGYANLASGDKATVPGGIYNSATAPYAFAAGFRAKAINQGTFVWADSTDADWQSTANNQFLIRANGGVGINTTAPQANTLTVGGSGLRVAYNGTTFKTILAGESNIGSSLTASRQVTVTFGGVAFSGTPKILATVRNDSGYPDVADTFAVSVRRISTTQFVANIVRVDQSSAWAQNPILEWVAWE